MRNKWRGEARPLARARGLGAIPLMALALALALGPGAGRAQVVEPEGGGAVREYVAYRAGTAPRIDGVLEAEAWGAAPWTAEFVDIGGGGGRPALRTRAKLLWDDEHLYVAAELEEPHVWGRLTARDAVIYEDDAFEVFIDPDGDTHAYVELEVNALGTVWDLLLTMPYRDGGMAVSGWDIRGLQVGVGVDGTVNDATDRDGGWCVELALPWAAVGEVAPGRRAPGAGEQWRLNFMRVDREVAGAQARHWVWSPQGAVNMHMPERWGVVRFSGVVAGSGEEAVAADADADAGVRRALRGLYYAQRRYRAAHGRYAGSLGELGAGEVVVEGRVVPVRLEATTSLYEISAPGGDGLVLHIRQDGRTWATKPGAVGTGAESLERDEP